jgi:peptide-methionine (S)-S-oxide reductase
VRTRVGYAGGSTPSPTYHDLGDHSEALQVDYDPTQISYEQLLDLFWGSHAPTQPAFSRQYRSAIFVADKSQRTLAEGTRAAQSARRKRPLYTAVEPLGAFHRAEDYHQKYYLRRYGDLMREFAGYSDTEFVDSRVAARLNGCLGAGGTPEMIGEALTALGLPAATSRRFIDAAQRRRR